MKANSSILLTFFLPHLDDLNSSAELPPNSGYFDLRTCEIHESIEKEDLGHVMFLEVTYMDETSKFVMEEGGLDDLGEYRYNKENDTHICYYEDFLEATKVAKNFLENNKDNYKFAVEMGYNYSCGQDNTPDSSDYWSEYVPVGVVAHKEYILEDVDTWYKEMIEANGKPRIAKRRKK